MKKKRKRKRTRTRKRKYKYIITLIMDEEKRREYIEALNTYYKLKTAYENAYNKDKNKIIKIKDLSWKEKRIEFSKLKPKCINCKRAVGSLFYTTQDKGERTLVAKCGDKSTPCPLNIVISLGYILHLDKELVNDEQTITNEKREIIADKNDLLFGYITSKEAVEKFESIKESYATTSTNYEFLLNVYNDIVDNKEKKEELKKEELELQVMIGNIKRTMKDFESTQNVQFVNDVVELYVKEMTPLLKEIVKKKYAVSSVEYDDADGVYKLIQKPISIENLETDLAEKEQGVVSLQMGVDKQTKRPRARSVKARPETEMKIVVPKKQTKKNRKKVLVLEPEPEPEPEEPEEEEEEQEEPELEEQEEEQEGSESEEED
jgi:hypothetical protein